MAQPFPTTFEKDQQSPMTPLSAGGAGNTPISYKANVNRMKTKKWTEAKPADYGGDDWGDEDEYTEPPAPISKPTGLRQQGQGLQSGPSSVSTTNDKKNYGNLPPIPGAQAATTSRPRANSFDPEDERRDFSNSTTRQRSPPAEDRPGPATRFSQITGVPSTREASGPPARSITTQKLFQQGGNTGLRNSSLVVSPISESSHPEISKPAPGRTKTEDSPSYAQPSRINTGESGSIYSQPSEIITPSSDYQAAKDFSPTAVPAPLSTTRASASPAPQSASITPASARFPARKSSLSQSTGPDLSQILPPVQETSASKPWVAGRSASPGASARSPSTPSTKALPFIRPADIYKRMEEEKERERQSMDSSRPSLDSLGGAKASERSESPARPLREKTSSDSLGGKQRTSLDKDDVSASGWHAASTLEPVKERKSEYGFEGFNMDEQATQAAGRASQTQYPSESTQLDLETARGSSVSPQLPDLNRMSGFGFDMFSAPGPEVSEVPLLQTKKPVSVPSSANTSAPAEDSAPERQSSFGYRSVVNQAFDVPRTPASQSGSEVRRSDSESTGTTGISPIMSRAPSGAVSDIRGREGANPSILEVVHEPSSPSNPEPKNVAKSDQVSSQSIAPIVEPGFRRQIRNPSPGNSPARTAKTEAVPQGEEAVLADPSLASPSTDEEEEEEEEALQPPRPVAAEREGSFRPSLPGGWTSYATTARSETPQPESPRASKEIERTQTTIGQDSSLDRTEGDHAITSNTTRNSLPQQHSALSSVVAGAALASAAGAAIGIPDDEKAVAAFGLNAQGGTRVADISPTPDSAVARNGNTYLADPLAARVLSTSTSSTGPSKAPTPPAKDTPILEDAEYFPKPTVPLKQIKVEQVGSDEALAPPTRPPILPTLSTDIQPQEEESDKLRKEIIKSLSPRPSDATQRHDMLAPDQQDDLNESRLSHYLPREYNDLWATDVQDSESAALATPTVPHEMQESAAQLTRPESLVSATPPIAPLGTRRTSAALETRPSMPNRFSWETTGESVNVPLAREDVPEMPSAPFHQQHRDNVIDIEPTPMSLRSAHDATHDQPGNLDYDKELGAQGLRSPESEPSDDDHIGRNAALLTGGAALGGVAAVAAVHAHTQPQATPSPQHERRLSLAEEKDPRVSSYPVSPTPPEDEHPSRSPQAYVAAPSTEQPAPSAPASSVSPVTSPTKTQFSPTSRILAFKEIAAMKDPHQRIETFDDTRLRFAAMDSGLLDWMTALKAEHPEHALASGTWGGAAFVPSGSVNPKYATPAGEPIPALQQPQPYYQQYLNASSPTTPGTPVSRPGPGIQPFSGSQQGLSPAGGKLTTQQVQAKGKELLHTAGIFGGKAGKAGKGLFAKGKNKLRGSGAGDKTSPNPSPPAKLKNDRRTSWGFPLGTSRSSGRPGASALQSKGSIPVVTPDQQRDTLGSRGSISARSSHDSLGLMSGADGLAEPLAHRPRASRGLDDEAIKGREPEVTDHLGIPPSISKSQPSWEPFSATPSAEQEGVQNESRGKEPPRVSHFHTPTKTKALATRDDDAASKSERSNSGDGQFYDAHEEPTDSVEWVMVSPAEARQAQAELRPAEEIKPDEETYEPPEGPPPSLLKPYQTSPVVEPEVERAPVPPSPIDENRQSDPTTRISQQPLASVTNQARSSPKEEHPETANISDPSQPQQQLSKHIPSHVETYEPPEGPPPSFLKRQQEQTSASELSNTPDLASPSVPRQPQPQSRVDLNHSKTPSTSSVLSRPRFSYEAPVQSQSPTRGTQNTSHYSPTQQNFIHSAREQQLQQQKAEEEDPSRNPSFKGLPPIRRTSTFGLGFGPRKGKQRFPIDDEDAFSSSNSQNYEAEIGSATGAATVATYANRDESFHQTHHTAASSTNLAQQRQASMDTLGSERPAFNQAQSSEYSQQTLRPMEEPQAGFQAAQAGDAPPEGLRTSQDAWRLNAVSPPTFLPPARNGMPGSLQRPSVERQRSSESQRQRALSDVSQTTTRTDTQTTSMNDRVPRPISGLPMRPPLYDQPPSSAQRYPELFQTQVAPPLDLGTDGELPLHMYQAPIPREAAFLPRQQNNEYQIPGVGPPVEQPRSDRGRRNSGTFFKDLGGRISRGTSRERRHSISQDEGQIQPDRPVISRGNDYAESSVTSEEGERRKRRSSFFGTLNRASTTGLGPPQNRESVNAHFPGSRTDLLATPQQSPIADRKRTIFGSAAPGGSPNAKPNKLSRASTSGMLDEPGKKKRFSALSSMFSRSGNPSSSGTSQEDRPQTVRQLSSNERQPLESPLPDTRQAPTPPPPVQNDRGPSQQRNFLTKLPTGGGDSSKSREGSKTRRSSASTLLSGIIGRKDQKDRSKDDSSSQGGRSQASQSQSNPQQIPLGQTYSDLQDEPSHTPAGPPPLQLQEPKRDQDRTPQAQPQERGRRASREPGRETREPQYASVPIPGGYDLVRGDGAMAVPRGIDPRGLAQFQQGQQGSARNMQQQPQGSYGPLQGGPQRSGYSQGALQPDRRISQETKPAPHSALESSDNYTKRASPRFSHEDLVARSPARQQAGQQRPYQLSLPEDEADRVHNPNHLSKAPHVISPPDSMRSMQPQIAQARHDVIQRLQQPVLRHPESPAGYPLPDDSVFSPINETARNIPPPPPPEWPIHSDLQRSLNSAEHITNQHLKLVDPNLDRSNTRRTTVSAISGMSGSLSPSLHPPLKDSEARDITPSPTPPSPAYTPERESSLPRYDEKESERGLNAAESERERGNERAGQGVRTTQITGRGSSPDLYNASPRLPSTTTKPELAQAQNGQLGIENGNGNGHVSHSITRDVAGYTVDDAAAKRAADTEMQKRKAMEEKIYYDAETGEEGHQGDEPEAPSMSATSYPGMEWNPYIAGGYDEYD